MTLKPQDIFVLLKLVSLQRQPWTYEHLAAELFMSQSEINSAVKRNIQVGLMREAIGNESNPQPVIKAFDEFLVHGLKYTFPPEIGGLTRGTPTGFAAPALHNLMSSTGDPSHVWPWATGSERGISFSPLYKSVPQAADKDDTLYTLLALVDILRYSSTRGREIAILALKAKFKAYA